MHNLEMTGERYIPGMSTSIRLEHLHRYALAREFVEGKNVLDIASGEGYGSYLLSKRAGKVTGVDISEDAVNHANDKYRSDNLSYRVGSCSKIPLPDKSVDVIVSFETIEHITAEEQLLFMDEISRVLKPDGVLIMSSPDKHEYSDVPSYSNPYHIKELYKDELCELIGKHFSNYSIFGQGIKYGSMIAPVENTYQSSGFINFDGRLEDDDEIKAGNIIRPVYFLVIASNEKIADLPSSIFEESMLKSDEFNMYTHTKETEKALLLKEFDSKLTSLTNALSNSNQNAEVLRANISEKCMTIGELEKELAARNVTITSLSQQFSDSNKNIEELKTDISEKFKAIAALDKLLAARDEKISSLTQQFSESNQKLETLRANISEKCKAIAALDKLLAARDEKISSLTQQFSESSQNVEELKCNLSQKEKAISSYSEILFEYNKNIQQIIQDKTEDIAELSSLPDKLRESSALPSDPDLSLIVLHQEITKQVSQMLSLANKLSDLNRKIDQVYNSRSWLITKPLRALSYYAYHKPYQFIRPLIASSLRTVWKLMPISAKQKDGLKNRIFKTFPFFFKNTAGYKNWLNSNSPTASSGRSYIYYTMPAEHRTPFIFSVLKPILRFLWVYLPFPISWKQKIKHFIFSYFPALFKHTQVYKNWLPEKAAGTTTLVKSETTSKPTEENLDSEEGLKSDFDGSYYLGLYPDLAKAKVDPYAHYFNFGRKEGRKAKLPILSQKELDPSKKTILVVSHDASRTGAPILAWNMCLELKKEYNLIGLLMGEGAIMPFFEDMCDVVIGPYDTGFCRKHLSGVIIDWICQRYKLDFAIVNSLESRSVLEPLARNNIPAVHLIHEFPYHNIYTEDDYAESLFWAGRVVFPAKMVRDSAHDFLKSENKILIESSLIVNQGKSVIPMNDVPEKQDNGALDAIMQLIKQEKSKPFVVLGAGTIQSRKGVDLFVDTAARIKKIAPKSKVIMIWIGQKHEEDYYKKLLSEISRHKLEDSCFLMQPVENLEEIYKNMDLFLLSSRQDPLPNVAIDAMNHGIPVFCFTDATGIQEILESDDMSKTCVIPEFDTNKAALKILEISEDISQRKAISQAVKGLFEKHFDMKRYVNKLLEILEEISSETQYEQRDYETILNSDDFNETYYLANHTEQCSRENAIRSYIRIRRKRMKPARKPSSQFNELPYVKQHKMADPYGSALADYIRNGRPSGPWEQNVINTAVPLQDAYSDLKTALHIHAYYPELLGDIISRLQKNDISCDLFISTVSENDYAKIATTVSSYNKGKVDIRITPNKGRNFGPLLSEFAQDLKKYDLIGHIHTKKSQTLLSAENGSALTQQFIENWTHFLLENMLGSVHPAAKRALTHLAKHEDVGIAYPADPYEVCWGENLAEANSLCERMGISEVPEVINSFPVGSMFWAKPAALEPLFKLNLTWDDYPEEPLPYDGSMLHAIERLLPIISKHQGYQESVIYTPGITR